MFVFQTFSPQKSKRAAKLKNQDQEVKWTKIKNLTIMMGLKHQNQV